MFHKNNYTLSWNGYALAEARHASPGQHASIGRLFFSTVCYTFIMQRTYWSSWKNFLERWGLRSQVCRLLEFTHPLLPFAVQLMVMGQPIFKGMAAGQAYGALLNMLDDEEALGQFIDYLEEAGS